MIAVGDPRNQTISERTHDSRQLNRKGPERIEFRQTPLWRQRTYHGAPCALTRTHAQAGQSGGKPENPFTDSGISHQYHQDPTHQRQCECLFVACPILKVAERKRTGRGRDIHHENQ